MRPVLDGSIKGFHHLSTDNHAFTLWDVGVAISNAGEHVHGLNISPEDSLPCPLRGSPSLDWCFSKAHIGHNTMLRFCKADEADDACLGVLVINPDTSRECLGQFRLDKYLSEEVNVENCWFSNQLKDHQLHVLVRRLSDCQNDWSGERWDQFPIMGKVVWWCGPSGNQVCIPSP